MADIHVLSQETINKIAAGEVVERPSAVVKEMVENAIDAGANSITVEIKDGGTSLIRITDNGQGIKREDVLNAFLPHATSKINDISDLESIQSLGFRGEALASIDAVSMMEMLTKTRDDFVGTRYSAKGGKEKEITETACPSGTTFIVKNLFFNTPARKKFLKKPATESGYISDILERIALSNPGIKIRFINQSQVKLETSGNGDLKDAIFRIYGRETYKNLISIDNENDDMKITGYIGKPSIVRGNKKCMNYFINGRYITSNVISKAISDSFSSYMMLHKFPFTCLMIEMNPKYTDVNVHPQKMEIRFADGMAVYDMIFHTLENALKQRELIPEVNIDDYSKKHNTGKTGLLGAPIKRKVFKKEGAFDNLLKERQAPYESSVKDETSSKDEKSIRDEKLIKDGIKSNEVINETISSRDEIASRDGVALKDDFSLNDKSNLKTDIPTTNNNQQIVSVSSSNENKTQVSRPSSHVQLLNNENIEEISKNPINNESAVPADNVAIKKGQINIFETDKKFMDERIINETRIIGQVFNTYWIIQYENNMYIVDQHAAHEKVNYERFMKKIKDSSVTAQQLEPPIIVTLSFIEEEFIKEHGEEFKELGFNIEPFGGKDYAITTVPDNLPEIGAKEMFEEMLSSCISVSGKMKSTDFKMKVAEMSCKAAIKGNMRFRKDEMENILKELMTLDNPYNCPHGRPTMVKFSKKDLEKMFKRIVN